MEKSHYTQRGRKLKLKQGRASVGYLLSFFFHPRDLPLPLRIKVWCRVVMCDGECLVGCLAWLVSWWFVRVVINFPTKWLPVGDAMPIALRRGLGGVFFVWAVRLGILRGISGIDTCYCIVLATAVFGETNRYCGVEWHELYEFMHSDLHKYCSARLADF
ncbi:hypothetical protein B9Z19DRAFT_304409 [Tuber borchii]|uniref:Uncharacterized protein n=1 Tax=Tuber borchii TaxID=42251 RepID=A0A2T6ZK62_TUBBO|nr:hypothetical protein B9Z19DRAFT_304409 [Tuber borchii]